MDQTPPTTPSTKPPMTPPVPPAMPPGAPYPPPPAGPVPRKSSGSTAGWIIGGIALAVIALMMVFFCGTCFFFSMAFRGIEGTGKGVALIEITGVMSSDSEGVGGTSSQEVVEQLVRARRSDDIKAVLIRVDSPGGTPAAAQEIYSEIKRTKEEKPVVISIGDMGASAAYYISSIADVIYASQDSDVGSIGVILSIPNIEGLDEKIGVRWYIYTQGQYKDIGSPFRAPTAEEEAILTGQMQVAYDHFIRDVAAGRKMDEARVRELANGLTWPGTQAKEIGLIDEIGNFRDAADRAGRLGGIEGDVHLVEMSTGGAFGLFTDFLSTFKEIANSLKSLVKQNGLSEERPQEQ